MAERTKTTYSNYSTKDSTPDSRATSTFTGINRSFFPEPSVAFDWHLGDSSQRKMMYARDLLIKAGNASPTEAQIKVKYQAMSGKITS